MKTIITGLLKKCLAPAAVKALLGAAAIGAIPTAALADHHDSDRHEDRRDDHRETRHEDRHEEWRPGLRLDLGRINIDCRSGPPIVVAPACPVYEDRPTQVWIDPVYRTVCDRHWVEAAYTTVSDRVWVPGQFEIRDVVRGRRVYRERVCVTSGHFELLTRQQMICDGHWESTDRQELVAPGHWESQVVRVAVR